MTRKISFALFATFVLVSAAKAAPIVTMVEGSVGGYKSLDLFYSASAGAEFTNYRLAVQSTNGVNIQDPVRTSTSDEGGDAVDTWANTVYSLLGFGPASYNYNAYKPVGIGFNTPPVAFLDWSVFDTGTGDTNDPGVGPTAPWHLARVLVSPDGTGMVNFQAFDSLSNGVPTVFQFPYGEVIPEPAVFSLLGLALSGLVAIRRRHS